MNGILQYNLNPQNIIERFHQTTESTKARMNIYLDNKRVDSNSKAYRKICARQCRSKNPK
ncbi:hypothetical protein [Helicobacter sp. MIT 05-5294]|uniref:hypothetical protein n=1 Tax=Helicobacter sp. MIT 05-5294 TaxID=1548150 RepID=UPI0010FEA435|nr:hypothetical protein [Helicobacter sp. MIT 05-5294]